MCVFSQLRIFKVYVSLNYTNRDALYSSWHVLRYRVYLQYHTWKQVLSGALVGFLFGSLWFALTYLIFTPVFPLIVSW